MEKILCNGIPKSGTHALIKAVQLLGQQTLDGHYPYAIKRTGKQIYIERCPRNMLVSALRFYGKPITQGNLIWQMKTYDEMTIVETFAAYSGYHTDSDTLVVSFEDLLADDAELRRIANFIGCPFLNDAFANIQGLTTTWTGRLSDWREHWTDEVEKAWIEIGGLEIDKKCNY